MKIRSVGTIGVLACLVFISIGLFTLTGCSSLHRAATALVSQGPIVEHVRGASPKEAPDLYKKAVDELESQKFQDALADFDTFLLNTPTSAWTQAARLNSGRALEGLKRWGEAADRYRSVIQATAKAPRLQAMALYRLSGCYEAMGDETQDVVTLNDLVSRAQFLPREIGQAELPAKLAGAYARIGNFDRAQEFYRRAEVGIARLRQESGGEIPEWLAQTYFSMGETSRQQISWSEFETSIRPFARGQIFLLQAAELNRTPWSDRAADELVQVYNSLFETIRQAPMSAGDPVLAKRALQKKQWSRVGLILDLMTELRARALPQETTSPQSAKVQKALDLVDRKIQNFLLERPAGEGLTDESRLRVKNRAALRVESVDDQSLEQAFIKSSQKAPPSNAQVPAPEPTPLEESVPAIRVTPPSPEDPNL